MDAVPRLFVVSGPLGCGKTTLCRRILAAARKAGLSVAGVLSPGRFEDGRKTGIEALDPRSGESRLLARDRVGVADDGPRLGRWLFDAAVLRWGDALLSAAPPCDLLVVDELGRLEFLHGEGWRSAMEAVSGGRYGQALVVVHADLVAMALERWPNALHVDLGRPEGRRALREHLLGGVLEPEIFA